MERRISRRMKCTSPGSDVASASSSCARMLLLTASRRRSSPRLRLVACCARAKYSLAHLRCRTGDIIDFLVLAQRPNFGRLMPEEDHGLSAPAEIPLRNVTARARQLGSLRSLFLIDAGARLAADEVDSPRPLICCVLSAACGACPQTHLNQGVTLKSSIV